MHIPTNIISLSMLISLSGVVYALALRLIYLRMSGAQVRSRNAIKSPAIPIRHSRGFGSEHRRNQN